MYEPAADTPLQTISHLTSVRFRHFVLWALLALLPLRGWAVSDMQISMATHALESMSSAEAVPEAQHHTAMPCHGEAAQSAHAQSAELTPEAAPEVAPESGHGACTLCDLCRSVVMVSTTEALRAVPTAAAQPLSSMSTDSGRAPTDRLERPPRRSFLS